MPINIGIAELGWILVLIGFLIILLAVLLIPSRGGDVGGIILIGPIPIVFGSWKFMRKYWWILSILGIILLILFLLPLLNSLQTNI